MRQSISGVLLLHFILFTIRERERDERGDVPGWVMVTLMSAMVIAALFPFIRDELKSMLQEAFAMVKKQ